ncbi:hypothetical protein pb186bvf_002399 [Paramecium bursaria]
MSHLAHLLKSHSDINGVTLYDHLNQFLFSVQNHSDMSTVELLSDFTKKNRFLFKKLPSDKEVNERKSQQPDFAEWVSQVSKLLSTQPKSELPTILQDFVTAARILETAGYGFGEEESYKIQLSLQRLAQETNAVELHFFGKILARGSDYYVARGVTPKQPTDHLGPNVEPRGEGCNYYTFWVTHDVLTDWNELPLITPEQVQVTREVKYVFTGNLNAEIKSYPKFPGLEKHFLKAQLVRITYANLIAPKGLYQQSEANPKELEFTEEFSYPEFPDLANAESWVHVPPQILKVGRITHYFDASVNEEQRGIIQEQDPENERLKAITEDRPLEPIYQSNWLVKVIGDGQVYGPKDEGKNNIYGVALLKNYTWPGAITVANQNGWANLYVGYGFKDTQASFVPIMNNDIQQEPDDIIEFPEPNPKTLPKPPVVDEPPQDPVDGADPGDPQD